MKFIYVLFIFFTTSSIFCTHQLAIGQSREFSDFLKLWREMPDTFENFGAERIMRVSAKVL
jgi:hypothetical protein